MARLLCFMFVLFIALAYAEHHGDHEDHDDIDKISDRLDEVAGRLYAVANPVRNRLHPKWKRKAHGLAARVLHLEEKHNGKVCGDHEHRCGQFDLQCVHDLFVCDGVKDCRNGEDENHCDSPIHAGDSFFGTVVHDECGYAKPKDGHQRFVIEKIKQFPFFTPFIGLRATSYLDFDYHGRETSYGISTIGYYSFASSSIVLLPPKSRSSYGLHCQFDGYNFNTCHGRVMTEGALHVCAEYVFEKEHH